MSIQDNNKIQTVIAGLGRAGWDIHWRQLLKDHPAYRVVAVIEPLVERRREAESEIGCRSYASFHDFLMEPCGELVVIATPSSGHGPESVACLEKGLHVAVDKPMCQGVVEADAMIDAARRNSLVLTCYHPYRFKEDFLLIYDVIRSGRLGRIVEIKCNRSSFSRRNDWIMCRAKGGGQHNVWGSHTVDQCLQLAGSPATAVFSDLQTTATPGDADDHCKIVMRCANGIFIDAEISNCMAFPPQPEWMVAGTSGGLVSSKYGIEVKWFVPEEAPSISLCEGPAANRQYDNGDLLSWRQELLPYPKTRGFVEFYDNLADAIQHGTALTITPESVKDNVAVLELCRKQNPSIWAGY